jgi:multiple sugar transport system ATP-binding protein
MQTGSFLQVREVTKRFGEARALHDVTINLDRDELLIVLGPTGAGKTTLLRTIAGLESPDAGSIRMNSEDVTTLAPAARDVALVFQNFSLYPNRTVRQNLEFPLRAPGREMSNEEISHRVLWAARMLQIEHLLERASTKLSGGEMQRVAIGRAIVRRPRVFLMDEPLTNLDAKLRESLRVELVMLRRQLKTPMIFVTHDQTEAMSMGDRIAVLDRGRILQIGSPRDVYRNPVSPTVARQIGQPQINLLTLPEYPGQLVGIRPADIEPAGGDHQAHVLVVESTGPESILLVRWRDHDVHMLVPRSRLTVTPGQTIFPRIRHDRMILWPRESS